MARKIGDYSKNNDKHTEKELEGSDAEFSDAKVKPQTIYKSKL